MLNILKIRNFDLTYNSFYLAGLTRNNIYIGNTTTPGKIIIANYELDTQHISIHFKYQSAIQLSGGNIIVDSLFFYWYNGYQQTIVVGSSDKFNEIFHKKTNHRFNGFIAISPTSFILREISDTLHQNILRKENNSASLAKGFYQPITQGDGIFSIDGSLLFYPAANKVIYPFYYKNEILILDSNLENLQVLNTVDTNKTVKISVSPILSEGTTTFSAPPLMVNKRSCISENKLFIFSMIRADNELAENFANNSVIDVYDLEKKKYSYSFYIPNLEGNKLKSFKIYHDKIVVTYQHHISVYTVNNF